MMICNWCPLAWECKLDKRNTSETYSLLNPSWGENQIVRTPADDQDCPLFRVFEQALGTGKAKKLAPSRDEIAEYFHTHYYLEHMEMVPHYSSLSKEGKDFYRVMADQILALFDKERRLPTPIPV